MAGSSMDLCKTAAQAAVDVMNDEQSVGILTFNDKFDWDVTLRNVGKNRDAIRKKIAAIGPGGHTLIFPALEQAYLALRNGQGARQARHPALGRPLVSRRLRGAGQEDGRGADHRVDRRGRPIGRSGAAQEHRRRGARDARMPSPMPSSCRRSSSRKRRTRHARLRREADHAGREERRRSSPAVDLTRMPQLKGCTATVIKDTALEVLATDDDDPLLAFWPIGLGRTAVFASDVKDRWAADWVRWQGYGPFFAAVVRALERQRAPAVALDITPGPVHGDARTDRDRDRGARRRTASIATCCTPPCRSSGRRWTRPRDVRARHGRSRPAATRRRWSRTRHSPSRSR